MSEQSKTPDAKVVAIVRPKKDSAQSPRGWENQLQVFPRGGGTKPSLGNAVTILANDPAWKGVLQFNEFIGRVELARNIPTHAIAAPKGVSLDQKFWTDDLTHQTQIWCERFYQVAFPESIMATAIRAIARKDTRHPIREYLSKLVWDKKKRLDLWLTKYLRVKESPYTRAVGAAWMISAVARAFEPGCKVDHVLIIEGGQRGGKSTCLRSLCRDEEWYLETDVQIGSKDALQVIRGKWIVELAELDSLARADLSKVKAFITCRIDTYRASYGREVIDQPRGCVFVGSTNDDEYLKDETGGGRWWPVWTPSSEEDRLDFSAVVRDRDQLWAEAVARYRAREPWHLIDPAILTAAHLEQEDRRQKHPWEDPIRAYLLNKKRQERGVSALEILQTVVGIDFAKAAVGDSMRVVRILSGMGWRLAETPLLNGRRTKIYKPSLFGTTKGPTQGNK